VINPALATGAFNTGGLDAMGQASGQLAALWAEGTSSYDQIAMTLTLSEPARWKAMAGGLLFWRAFGASELTDAAGEFLTGVVGVVRFHPQSVLRIQRLAGVRFDGRTDGSAVRPIPYYAAIRDGRAPDEMSSMVESDPPLAPADASVGTALTHGRLTFHDELGLIIDPVAVACMFRDLMQGFPALRNPSAGQPGDLTGGTGGSIKNICDLAAGRRLHIVNLFGGPWSDRPGAVGLRFGSGPRLTAGPHDWPDGQTLNATASNGGDLRFGFSPEGTLGTAALSPPDFPGTVVPAPVLGREFFRVVAVDLALHLSGNRTATAIEEVPRADPATVLEPSPAVRDGDTLDILVDGQAAMGAVTEVALLPGFRLAVSPTIATDVLLPASRADRWPAVPAPTETPEPLDADRSRRARSDVTGTYVGSGPDVALSWPAGSLPAEAHVRVFPRVDPGPAIVPLAELDFSRRGDGASGIAKAAGLTLLVKDPYRVGTGAPPAEPALRFDLLVVTRAGVVRGRLFGGLEVSVGTGGIAPTEPPASNALSALPQTQQGISPSPRLGLAPTAPATGTDLLLADLAEVAPRQSPRYRTMARTETVIAGHDGGSPGGWRSVLTSGFLNGRSVRDSARLGNPGNPAGPEDHSPGIHVTGQLALDLARAALRRTHQLVDRVQELNEGRWNATPAGSGTVAGAILQNVAQKVESPELDLLEESLVHALPDNWSNLIANIQPFLPSSLNPLVSAVPAPDAADRWVQEVRREAFAAKHGRRDSQWSWRWAISHARRFIYLETSLLSATAAGTNPHEVDLIPLLRNRLTSAPELRVVIAIPKRIPFGPGYESFAQRFHLARNEVVASLQPVAPKRVVIYHPIGFPGRPEVIRGTIGVVDDVWALLGSSTFSRRGLTFDGSIDLVLLDRVIKRGVSETVRNFRKHAMARTLGLAPPVPGETASAGWVRLAQQRSAFELVREIVERGGDGLIEPLWSGLPEAELPAVDRDLADPEGREFSTNAGAFAEILAGLGQDRV
jgi:hypothetical protein